MDNRTGNHVVLGGEQHLNKHGKPAQWWLNATAEDNFDYWMSSASGGGNADLVDVDAARLKMQGRRKSIERDENGLYLWQRRNEEWKDRKPGSMSLYESGQECLEIWMSASQR